MTAVRFEPNGSVTYVDVGQPTPACGQVAVEVSFAGINPTDTYHRRRVMDGGDEVDRIPGVEVCGRVSEVAEASQWNVGDRVFGLVHDGGLRRRVIADADLLVRVPDNLDDLEAAAIPEAFITAHDAVAQSGLTDGETLLVTGATGGVGLAAVQIGLARGARVLGVSRSPEGDELLRGLGVEPVADQATFAGHDSLPYRDAVDVVVELVGGRNASADLAALRPKGRIVFVAAQGDEDLCVNLRELKAKRATIMGSTLRRRGREAKVEAVRAFAHEILPLLADSTVKPVIAARFSVQEASRAFDFLASSGKRGKVLLQFE